MSKSIIQYPCIKEINIPFMIFFEVDTSIIELGRQKGI